MGYFNQEAVDDLHNGLADLPRALLDLREAYAMREYKEGLAREHAQHGLCRRLATMVHSVQTVFQILPPDLDTIPERAAVMDATAAIQTFVINAFGCMENLAWIWVLEKDLRGRRGAKLDRLEIGLGKRYVRPSFSDEFRAFLDGQKDWLANLIGFRDGLAHRIPLYIAPYVIDDTAAEAHRALDTKAMAALVEGNRVEYDRLRGEQQKLGRFRPWMTHSVYEKSPAILFHPQMIQDFKTVDSYCRMLLKEFGK
ncbi:hypothetical protein LPW26_14450 [Rhodopseudomonas sp. HC1]|uniref:hypothetical protein n=1 Tax=Rhodopseudomonas infernalis TaxID=2897386 RepID=UPI001EE8486C|nr:hypothetical protein [Rhodopseudomonas infernalis]MCG6205849.1 hypothetical protein [Rhodopseudomonas infernalis]